MHLAIFVYKPYVLPSTNKSDDDDEDCFTPFPVLYNQSCNPFSDNAYETLFLEKRNTIPDRQGVTNR